MPGIASIAGLFSHLLWVRFHSMILHLQFGVEVVATELTLELLFFFHNNQY